MSCHHKRDPNDLRPCAFCQNASELDRKIMARAAHLIDKRPPLAMRATKWVLENLGERLLEHRWERIMRFLEEAMELAQAEGVTQEDALRLLARVYHRPVGKLNDEAAGALITLTVWAEAANMDLVHVAHAEIDRMETMPKHVIRRRQSEKASANVGLWPPKEEDE